MKTQSLIWSCVVVGLVSAAAGFGAAPPELTGLCLSVESGDTIIVATDDGKIRVRLAGVRAPVDGQPFAVDGEQHVYDVIGHGEGLLEVIFLPKHLI